MRTLKGELPTQRPILEDYQRLPSRPSLRRAATTTAPSLFPTACVLCTRTHSENMKSRTHHYGGKRQPAQPADVCVPKNMRMQELQKMYAQFSSVAPPSCTICTHFVVPEPCSAFSLTSVMPLSEERVASLFQAHARPPLQALMYAPLPVDTHKLAAIVDSGAADSFISSKMAQQMALQYQKLKQIPFGKSGQRTDPGMPPLRTSNGLPRPYATTPHPTCP